MLRAAAQARQQEAGDHAVERARQAGKTVADGDQQRAGRQHAHAAQADRQLARRDLPARHGAGIDGLERADGGVAQAELSLQQRIKDVQQIGEAVMQRMGPAAYS